MELSTRFELVVEKLRGAAPSGYRYPSLASDTAMASARGGEAVALLEALGAVAPGGKVDGIAIDAGCGEGPYLSKLTERFKYVLGFDADAGRVETARKACPAAAVCHLALESPLLAQPPIAGAAKVVLCNQVLGHVPRSNLELVLHHLCQMLAPEGRLILAVPYTNQPQDEHFVFMDATSKDRPATAEEIDVLAADPRPGLLPTRHFALGRLRELLGSVGLEIERSAPYAWYGWTVADLLVVAKRG